MARERLRRLLALGDGPTPEDWDYYPARPVKEEILETRSVPGVAAVVTRNRAGALVLNTDRVAFVDVDLAPSLGCLLLPLASALGRARGRKLEQQALARAKAWSEESRARLRVYRTARGLRLLRLDALVDPQGEECARMFTALGADPQYARLCRAQGSFRARLSPKPARIGQRAAPGNHPRTWPSDLAAFQAWREGYERACAGFAVCRSLGELGSGSAQAAPLAIGAFHDAATLRAGELA